MDIGISVSVFSENQSGGRGEAVQYFLTDLDRLVLADDLICSCSERYHLCLIGAKEVAELKSRHFGYYCQCLFFKFCIQILQLLASLFSF